MIRRTTLGCRPAPAPRAATLAAVAGLAAAALSGVSGCARAPASRQGAPPPLSPAPAEAVARDLRGSGVPVHVSVVFTPETDPDALLGRPGGYVSKLAFVDSRVNGGEVADGDPGSVALGGVIEVFPDADLARRRAQRLQQAAVGIPTLAEYDFLSGRTLIRVSRYLTSSAARQYLAILHAVDVRPTPHVTTQAPPIGV